MHFFALAFSYLGKLLFNMLQTDLFSFFSLPCPKHWIVSQMSVALCFEGQQERSLRM